MPQDDDGLDLDALEAALDRGRAGVPLHDPDLPEPERPHAPRRAPAPPRRARARPRPAGARGRPVRARPLRGRPAADCCTSSRAASCVTYSSSFSKTVAPGLRVGYFVLPDAARGARSRHVAVSTYITPVLLGAGDGLRVRAPGRLRAEPRARPRAAAAPPRRDARGARARAAGGRDVEPARGRLLPLGRLRRATSTRRELLARATEAGVTFVRGSDFFPAAAAAAPRRGSRSASSRPTRSARASRGSPRSCPARGLATRQRAARRAPTGRGTSTG